MMDTIKTALDTTDVKISEAIYAEDDILVHIVTENESGDRWLLVGLADWDVRELNEVDDLPIEAVDAIGDALSWDEDDFINVLEDDFAPDHEFTAVAGSDYGYVYVWELPESGRYAVKAGNNSMAWNDLLEADEIDLDDLAQYCTPDDCDTICLANITADLPDAAGEDEPCGIIKEVLTTDGNSRYSWITDECSFYPMTFDNRAEAEKYISGTIYLQHGEISVTYHIV